jgi:hypothetical protein
LKPFPIKPAAIYPLEEAKAAFMAVAGSSRDPAARTGKVMDIDRHCERSEAIHRAAKGKNGLLRFARNDGRSGGTRR